MGPARARRFWGVPVPSVRDMTIVRWGPAHAKSARCALIDPLLVESELRPLGRRSTRCRQVGKRVRPDLPLAGE